MDVIFELANGRGISYNGGGGPMLITTSTAKSSGVVPEAPLQAQADHHHHHHHGHVAAGLLLRRTAQRAPRAPAWTTGRAVPRRRWRCLVCQVECGGRDGFREHCMSDEHYHGLQLFGLRPDLFADRIDVA